MKTLMEAYISSYFTVKISEGNIKENVQAHVLCLEVEISHNAFFFSNYIWQWSLIYQGRNNHAVFLLSRQQIKELYFMSNAFQLKKKKKEREKLMYSVECVANT